MSFSMVRTAQKPSRSLPTKLCWTAELVAKSEPTLIHT